MPEETRLVETGFEDVEVYEQPDLSSMPLPIALSVNQMVAIAREMAMAIRADTTILRAAGITKGQFEEFIVGNPLYKRAFETFIMEWESALSTNKRIAIQAAAGLEDALPHLALRMTDDKEQLNQKVETAKLFAKLAGAGEIKEGAAVGERFSISIILGPDQQAITKTIEAVPGKEITGDTPLLPITVGKSNSTPV